MMLKGQAGQDFVSQPLIQSSSQPSSSYFDRTPVFENDEILDENGEYIMMEWEREIMEKSAEVICRKGGDILNVGFGMGIIDSYIEEHRPRTHWIIEGHPAIQKKIIEGGWLQKPHVKVIFKPWQEVIYNLPKFDGIYFDTWNESQEEFDLNVHNILKPDGVFSFFNNPAQSESYWNQDEFYMAEWHQDALTKFNLDFEHMEVQADIPEGLHYWHSTLKQYHIPVCTLKQEYR